MPARQGLLSAVIGRFQTLWRRLWAPVSGDASVPTTQPMGGSALRILVVYLTLLTLGGGWVTWTVWAARPTAPAEVAWSTPATPEDGAPTIARIVPDTLIYGAGRPVARVLGNGFSGTSQVLVDGQPHPGGRFIAPDQMILELSDSDFRQAGTRAVSVTRDSLRSRPAALYVESEATVTVSWSPIPGFATPISVESRLLLLVLFMGGLGGTLASFHSLSNYRGEGKLLKSWFLHYWLAPFMGGGIAVFLYLVIRAGLLSGTDVHMDANSTPWGVVAISGLAGLFYDKTFLKLREVFITLFNPRDDRGGKLHVPLPAAEEGLAIVSSDLTPATRGETYRAKLEAKGGRPAYSWSVEPDLPGGLLLDPLTGVVSGTPTEAHALLTYEFSVTDMERGRATAAVDFEVRS